MGRNRNAVQPQTPRAIAEAKYKNCTRNILLLVLLTVVNVVFLVADPENSRYFLFSAYIPYFCAEYGLFMCGMFPAEVYRDVDSLILRDKSFLAVMLCIGAVCVLLYVLSFIFANKMKLGWLIFALVFFAIDTIFYFLLMGFAPENILDIVMHVLFIADLVWCIVLYNRWKKAPDTEEVLVGEETQAVLQTDAFGNSQVLRQADTEVKARTLAQAEAIGHSIIYRRVKNVNELVIDGKVYDEYVATLEFAHTLQASVNGHKIIAEFDGRGTSYIFADGEQVAKKIRLL